MNEIPDNCYPGYWIEKIKHSSFTPDNIKNSPDKVGEIALALAIFNSVSPAGSNAFSKLKAVSHD